MDEIEISHSKSRTWRRCQQKYDYKYEQKLERKKPAVQLLRGRIIGECIDALIERRSNPNAPHWNSVLEKYFNQYRLLFKEEREMYGDLIHDCTTIVMRYENLYADDGLTYHDVEGKHSELPLVVDMGDGITFKGFIDKLPQDKQKRTWIMDHKTHKTIPDEDTRFSDLQLVFYYWAAPLADYPKPSGVMWDYVRTKPPAIPEMLKKGGLSQRKNIDTTYDVYLNEVKRHKLDPAEYREILDELKPYGESQFFKRVMLPKPNEQLIETVVNDLRRTANEIRYLGGKSKIRTMQHDCKQCEFYSLCQAELRGLDADYIRKSEYQIKGDRKDVASSKEIEGE